MSTKCTLDHGEDHHLYVDLLAEGKVYLELRGAEFEARPDRVTVGIPLDLWERLRAKKIVAADWWDWEGDPKDSTPGGNPT